MLPAMARARSLGRTLHRFSNTKHSAYRKVAPTQVKTHNLSSTTQQKWRTHQHQQQDPASAAEVDLVDVAATVVVAVAVDEVCNAQQRKDAICIWSWRANATYQDAVVDVIMLRRYDSLI